MTEIRNIKVTIEEKNLIINNGADKLPLNPTSQGFSGQSVRKQLSQAVTGAKGSVLALMIEKFSIIEDFSNTVLLVEVKVVGNDLKFVYADGREFNFSLDGLLDASKITQDETNRFVTDAEKIVWNAKQNALTAGENITITGNVISAPGGGYEPDGITIVLNGNNKLEVKDNLEIDGGDL